MASKRMALIAKVMMIKPFRAELERLSNGATHRILTSLYMLGSFWRYFFSKNDCRRHFYLGSATGFSGKLISDSLPFILF
jgi:hypothetical protein